MDMERLEGIINTYAWELVDIELLRRKLEDEGVDEEYFTVLELATKAAKDKVEDGIRKWMDNGVKYSGT